MHNLRTLAIAGLMTVGFAALLSPLAGEEPPAGVIGPDLVATSVGTWFPIESGVKKWGTENGVTAYTFAAFGCNLGDEILPWNGFTEEHPVFLQHMYRLENGRLEQIGISSAKHVTATVDQDLYCGTCNWPGFFLLGPGCSDPYDAPTNGDQTRLGPRSDINASTGTFPFPHAGQGETGGPLFKRLQVHNDDLDPTGHPNATYFIEAQYVSAIETAAGNHLNNASYVEIQLEAFVDGGWELSAESDTIEQAAIFAWAATDPAVQIETIDIPGDGRIHVASRCTDNADGTWHYEYAVHNYNSHRSVGAFAVGIPAGVDVTNIGFHDVDYHSGSTVDGKNWAVDLAGGLITWSTDTIASNPNANAIRWGTLYNFRFDADAPPDTVNTDIALFRTGSPTTVSASVCGPVSNIDADINNDGQIDVDDLVAVILAWGPCAGCNADTNGDDAVDVDDLVNVILGWTL